MVVKMIFVIILYSPFYNLDFGGMFSVDVILVDNYTWLFFTFQPDN